MNNNGTKLICLKSNVKEKIEYTICCNIYDDQYKTDTHETVFVNTPVFGFAYDLKKILAQTKLHS